MGLFSFKRSSQTSPSSKPLNDDSKKKKGRHEQLPKTHRPRVPKQIALPIRPRKRKGRSFCGCCDMRIATCLFNISHMIIALITEMIEASKWGNRNYLKEPPVLLIMAILISSMGLNGAIRFSRIPLIASSILLVFLCFFYAGEMDYGALIFAVLVFVAQVCLADEINRGIMTEETYDHEEYIDESGKAVYMSVRDKAIEISEAAAEINRKKEAERAAKEKAQEKAKKKSMKNTPEIEV